tara:strand:+ start:11311 stop:12564 length:1254 start_codon:yes stop_codon:yes gene_type:complete
MPYRILDQLKGVLAGRHDMDIGQLQLINLDLVRLGAGDRWDKLRTKIFDVSIHFIEKRIGANDVLIRCEEGFLLLFGEDDAQANEARTREISEALNLFFLGDEILKQLQIKSLARRMDLDNLASLMSAEGITPKDKVETRTRSTAEDDTDPVGEVRTVGGYDFGRDSEPVFLPIWDSRRQAITTQFCTLKTLEYATGETVFGRDFLRGHDDPRDHLAYDLTVCEAASNAMRAAEARGRRVATCIQTHVKTLTSRDTRVAYFEALADIPEAMREYLFVRVDGILPGTPVSTLQEVFQSLRPYCGQRVAKLSFGETDLSRFRGLGIFMFGWNCPPLPADYRLTGNQQARLTQFAKSAAQLGASVYLSRPPSGAVIDQAIESRVRFLAGPRVAPMVTTALSPVRMEIADIRRRNNALVLT